MTTQLNQTTRGLIIKALLAHRYDADQAANRAVRQDLAEQVYNLHYSSAMQKRLAKLPKGWLPEISGMKVFFEGDKGDRVGKTFSLFLKSGSKKRCLDKDHSNYDGLHVRLELSKHKDLHTQLYKADDRKDELESGRRATERQLRAMLSKFRSIKKLVEAWPEVKPFIPKDATAEANALIPVQALNEQLRLP